MLSTAAHVSMVWFLLPQSFINPILANTLAFCVALVVSFFGNYIWTFGAPGQPRRALARFFIIALSAFALNTALLALLLHGKWFSPVASVVISASIFPLFTYLASRLWAFKSSGSIESGIAKESKSSKCPPAISLALSDVLKRIDIYLPVVIFAWLSSSWHWLSGKSFIPWDSVAFFFPQVAFIVNTLLRGESPTWNPLIFGGAPVLGDPQGMLFTPHVLTGLVSGSGFGLWVFDVTTLACILAGALCLYRYARSHGSVPALAALGAIVFLLGGYGTSRLQHVAHIISYASLPILLFTFRNVVLRPNITTVFALSASGFLLAFNPNHVVFLIPFLLGPLLFLELIRAPRKLAALAGLFVACALVVLPSIPYYAAILETVENSNRAIISLQSNSAASLPGFVSLSLLIPSLFYDPSGIAGYWGPADLTESYLYIGIIPAIVIIASLAQRRAPLINVVVSWIMGGVAFLFAMGTHGPLFPWLFNNIPGFSLFRRPSDGAYFLIFYCALAVALSSAPGSGRLRGLPERLIGPSLILLLLSFSSFELLSYAAQLDRIESFVNATIQYSVRFGIAVIVIFIIWFLLPHKQRRAGVLLAVVSLSTFDLASAGRWGIFAAKYENHGFPAMFRVLDSWRKDSSSEAKSMRELEALHLKKKGRVEIVGMDNAIMALGFPMTQGYNPLHLRRYAEVFGAQSLSRQPKQFSEQAPSIDSEAYRWLGLRFLLLHGYIIDHPDKFGELGKKALELRNSALVAGGREIETQGTYRIIEMHNVYPRAGFIADGDHPIGYPKYHCQVISETTTSGRYFCDTPTSGRIVIGDSFAPGWLACVNGLAVPVEPFMHALRSVSVAAGINLVEFRYQPVPFLRRFETCTCNKDD